MMSKFIVSYCVHIEVSSGMLWTGCKMTVL